MNDLVSVIIPAYNHERFIVSCLESLKQQTYQKIEVLVCDDCSSDTTFRVAKEWAEENSTYFQNCVVIRNEINKGVTRTLNRLLDLAQGDYIKLLASDDMLLPDGIEKLVNAIKDKNADIVYANAYKVKEEAFFPVEEEQIIGKVLKKRTPCKSHPMDDLYEWNYIPAYTVLIRKDCYDRYGGFSEKCTYEDWEYWLRLASNGATFGYVNELVAFYRINEKSASHFLRTEAEKQRFERIIDELAEMLKEYASYTEKTMDGFWNNTLSTALHQHNDKVIARCLEQAKQIKFAQWMKVILYKVHLYDFVIRVFQREI